MFVQLTNNDDNRIVHVREEQDFVLPNSESLDAGWSITIVNNTPGDGRVRVSADNAAKWPHDNDFAGSTRRRNYIDVNATNRYLEMHWDGGEWLANQGWWERTIDETFNGVQTQ